MRFFNLFVTNVFLLFMLSSCSVESANISPMIPKTSAKYKATNKAIKTQLNAISSTLSSIGSVVNGVSTKVSASTLDEHSIYNLDLSETEGELSVNEENEFTYEHISSEEIGLNGEKLKFFLRGRVEYIEEEADIIDTELKVVYSKDGNEYTFRIAYQNNTNANIDDVIELQFDLEAIKGFYSLLSGSDINNASVSGELKVVISNDSILVKGKDFSTQIGNIQIYIDKVDIEIDTQGEITKDLFAHGSITQSGEEIGHFAVENTADPNQPNKFVFKIDIDSNSEQKAP
jgi:hypothetical protein